MARLDRFSAAFSCLNVIAFVVHFSYLNRINRRLFKILLFYLERNSADYFISIDFIDFSIKVHKNTMKQKKEAEGKENIYDEMISILAVTSFITTNSDDSLFYQQNDVKQNFRCDCALAITIAEWNVWRFFVKARKFRSRQIAVAIQATSHRSIGLCVCLCVFIASLCKSQCIVQLLSFQTFECVFLANANVFIWVHTYGAVVFGYSDEFRVFAKITQWLQPKWTNLAM